MELLIAIGFFGLISAIIYYVLASRAPVFFQTPCMWLKPNALSAELVT